MCASEKTARLAVTLGDPAGIGPEVSARALMELVAERPGLQVYICGATGVADDIAQKLQQKDPTGVFEAHLTGAFAGPMAAATAESGSHALAALHTGIDLVEAGRCDALVTAPINKQALALAGSEDRGHTEILARRLGAGPVAMAFFAPRLKVVLATVHIPLRNIWQELTPQRVADVAALLSDAIARYDRMSHDGVRPGGGAAKPRLGLAGLNPHAGEHGLLGDEEQTILAPAVAQARQRGVDLSDPVSPDAVFGHAVQGRYDGVVALYHDQGLIPVKMLAFGDAVNVTLGLRKVRTSPDHGTAYDLVGTGRANHRGMLRALQAALHFG